MSVIHLIAQFNVRFNNMTGAVYIRHNLPITARNTGVNLAPEAGHRLKHCA